MSMSSPCRRRRQRVRPMPSRASGASQRDARRASSRPRRRRPARRSRSPCTSRAGSGGGGRPTPGRHRAAPRSQRRRLEAPGRTVRHVRVDAVPGAPGRRRASVRRRPADRRHPVPDGRQQPAEQPADGSAAADRARQQVSEVVIVVVVVVVELVRSCGLVRVARRGRGGRGARVAASGRLPAASTRRGWIVPNAGGASAIGCRHCASDRGTPRSDVDPAARSRSTRRSTAAGAPPRWRRGTMALDREVAPRERRPSRELRTTSGPRLPAREQGRLHTEHLDLVRRAARRCRGRSSPRRSTSRSPAPAAATSTCARRWPTRARRRRLELAPTIVATASWGPSARRRAPSGRRRASGCRRCS